jgi:hypothetical protein
MGPKLRLLVVGAATLFAPGYAFSQTARPPASLTPVQAERFCEEERRFAEPWIQWAAESRLACIQQSASEGDRSACLDTVRAQLDTLQQEHAGVYLSQMKSLRSDHPVMVKILQRLQANQESARTAIETGADPAQLALHRQQTCLNQR